VNIEITASLRQTAADIAAVMLEPAPPPPPSAKKTSRYARNKLAAGVETTTVRVDPDVWEKIKAACPEFRGSGQSAYINAAVRAYTGPPPEAQLIAEHYLLQEWPGLRDRAHVTEIAVRLMASQTKGGELTRIEV